jgi:hypothetical protein
MLGLKFEPAGFVGVEGRIEGVLIDFELLDEVLSLGLIGGDIDRDLPGAILAFDEPALNYVKHSQHFNNSSIMIIGIDKNGYKTKFAI